MSVTKSESSDEWFFSSNQYILSETDDKGFIVYANDLFCEIADYKLDELIGKGHNIVRHPDMPRVAFKALWEDIKSKGFWTGIVKNLRKDGGYYWVHATVLRKTHKDGSVTYLSVRRVPNRREIESSASLYVKLKHSE